MWLGSMIADPYTAWGVEHEEVRPGMVHLSEQLAIAALGLLIAAGLAVYWRQGMWWRGWLCAVFAAALLFFGETAIARLLWIWFYVQA